MIGMHKIECIKKFDKEGKSITEIAQTLDISQPTVRKFINKEDFSPKIPKKRGRKSIMDKYVPIITEWLIADKNVRRKQRHTAHRIFERLRDEHGCCASESTVRHTVAKIKNDLSIDQQHYLDLDWPPGQMQADFGEADFCYRGVSQTLEEFVCSFPYSNIGLGQIFPGHTSECVCEGLIAVFEYIDGVPTKIVFDNATEIGRRLCNEIKLSELFKRFALHYGFDYEFCNPYAGHEKGSVENKVGYIRRNLLVPPPRIENIANFNKKFIDDCYNKSVGKTHYKRAETETALFEEDKFALLPLPEKRFIPERYAKHKCDKYGNICLNSRHYYSVSPEFALKNVIVGYRALSINIYSVDGEFLCEHERAYGDTPTNSHDPTSQLNLLCRRPRAWQNSSVRATFSEDLRAFLDSSTKEDLREHLKLLRDTTHTVGYRYAIDAFESAYALQGKLCESSVALLAAKINEGMRIIDYGDEINLEVYDSVFKERGSLNESDK